MAELKTYYASVLSDDGEIEYRTRMLGIPLKTTLTEGIVQRQEFVLPKYDNVSIQTVKLWEYVSGQQEDFAAILIENLGTGIVHIQWKGDMYTSQSDSDPAGTHVTYNTVAIAPHVPFFIGSDAILVNSDKATHAGGPLTASGEVVGKVYLVEAWNPDTAATQTVRMTRFN